MNFHHGSGGGWCRSQSNARLEALAVAMRRKVLPGIILSSNDLGQVEQPPIADLSQVIRTEYILNNT